MDISKLLLDEEKQKALGLAKQAESPTNPHQLVDDAGFTQNVIMKGIPGMETDSPNFSGPGGVAWAKGGIPVTQEGLPPSPISPDWQTLALSAKPNSPESTTPVEVTKPVKTKSATKKAEEPKATDEKPLEEVKPASPSVLEQLLSGYNQPKSEDDELKKLQQDRINRRNNLDIIDAVSQVFAGGTKSGYNATNLDNLRKGLDQEVTDLQDRRKSEKEERQEKRTEIDFAKSNEKFALEMEKARSQMADEKAKSDPNSEISTVTKDSIATMLEKVGRGDQAKKIRSSKLSSKQLEDVYGQMNIQNYISMYEAQQNRLAVAKENAAARKAAAETKAKDKKEENLEKFTTDFRKELTGSGAIGKAYGNFLNADRSYNVIQGYLKKPSGYSDYASIMGSLKALQGDDSVVREAEVKMGMQATSLPNKIKNWTDSMASGKMLQPEQRKQMAQAVQVLREVAADQFKRAAAPVLNQADKLGVNRSEILGTDFLNENPPPSQIVSKQYSPSRNQTRITYSDGRQEIVDGKRE